MWIDNEVYNEFEIMARNQGWCDDIVEFINHVSGLEMSSRLYTTLLYYLFF
jgi:hypothetical protein